MATKTIDEDKVLEIVADIGVSFPTFGGGVNATKFNPLSEMLKDRPLQFAMGVDVAAVVRFVLERQ